MIKHGNILNSTEQVIVQQCNCISVKPLGLSKSISDRYSHGNHYGSRKPIGRKNIAIKEDRDEPGTVVILYSDDIELYPHIACLMGQWQPGKINCSNYTDIDGSNDYKDTRKNREMWFKHGLSALGQWCLDEKINSVAFPYMIGCGLAGGDWETYLKMIKEFAKTYNNIHIVIYKL